MKPLGMEHFDDFFRALHRHDPYPWQQRLAEAALAGSWPPAIDLPTSSGKTACLDVAIFALACQASRSLADRTAPVRVFFCVNRRVIVDEACERAKNIAKKLWEAEKTTQIDSVLNRAAAMLRRLNPLATRNHTPPLDVLELRGGIYRDNRWARSAIQPTIICTTVDQLGSRLLFRGYGVSPNAAPVQAALIAYDSLILLDEAHISRPFLGTLVNVRRYLNPEKWSERSVEVNPAVIVPMTATAPEGVDGDVIRLSDDDRANESLGRRLAARKPAQLRGAKDIVKATVSAARDLAGAKPTAVGIVVNRVATARDVFKRLCEEHPEATVELVIGSMRPIDRDLQAKRLRQLIGPERPAESTQMSFVVATQCLEVGADYDFDALVTECASLDAPVMLPAHVDFWCQTLPRPLSDPDVALFLHGRQRGNADVQVCWRADLREVGNLDRSRWPDVVALLPPSSAECMTVPLSRARRWLADLDSADQSSDLLDGVSDEMDAVDDNDPNHRRLSASTHLCVVWRGPKESKVIQSPRDLRPGDTLVIPVSVGGWDVLGHIPQHGEHRFDVAEEAYQKSRDRAALRLHPVLLESFPDRGDVIRQLGEKEDLPTAGEWRELLVEAGDGSPQVKELLAAEFVWETYPDNQGVVLISRRRVGVLTHWFLPPLDDGDDAPSRITGREAVPLVDHVQHVVETLHQSPNPLTSSDLSDVLIRALGLHDLGKADERFQAMLRRTDRTDAWLAAGRSAALIAKSDGLALSPAARRRARERAGLPDGFRHEMLSLQLAERASDLPDDAVLRDLVLHLIAAHHGYARPFVPVVVDDGPPNVEVQGLSLTTSERLARPAHRLDSGIAERFWKLTRHFGWWGLAYLESLVRLADQQASAMEDAGEFEDSPHEKAVGTMR